MHDLLANTLTRMFGRPEEIDGAGRCPTYLYRWHAASIPGTGIKVYFHRFVGSDWSKDMHNHPRRFVTIGLWGWYYEETPQGNKFYRAPWIRSFSATHVHRLVILPGKQCWTLAIVFRLTQPWGFYHEGEFIPWREYVWGYAKEIADRMRSCVG